jgi:hypothetical protein
LKIYDARRSVASMKRFPTFAASILLVACGDRATRGRDAQPGPDVETRDGAPTDADWHDAVVNDLGVPSDGAASDVPGDGQCVPNVPRGGENTDDLCSDGIDNDCNGYIDCNDFACSRNPNVTVCPDAGHGFWDGGPRRDSGPIPDTGMTTTDAGPVLSIGPGGGTVDRLRFGMFGDVRPANMDQTAGYPTTVIDSVMDGLLALGAQFVVASGDYMFATNGTAANAQLDLLLSAEGRYGGHVFHTLGNHECNGFTASNCPLGNETANIQAFHARLASAYATPYYDWMIHTTAGDAHFIATAPNAWSTAQQAWLTAALAQPALYTFVIAHEPANENTAPGSTAIESAIAARTGGVTLRLYGHTHEYRHLQDNAIIAGNAGAPLSFGGFFGFVTIEQRADLNIIVTAYQIGDPPMVQDSFVLSPGGTLVR